MGIPAFLPPSYGISVLIGFMPAGTLRMRLIMGWWLAPIWLMLFATAAAARRMLEEYTVGELLIITLFLLVPSAAVTIFPFKLNLPVARYSQWFVIAPSCIFPEFVLLA